MHSFSSVLVQVCEVAPPYAKQLMNYRNTIFGGYKQPWTIYKLISFEFYPFLKNILLQRWWPAKQYEETSGCLGKSTTIFRFLAKTTKKNKHFIHTCFIILKGQWEPLAYTLTHTHKSPVKSISIFPTAVS